jgi:sugar lactone lactonase YvrE
MRRLARLAALGAVLALGVPVALAGALFPSTIQLPNGFQPEGIAIGNGATFYVGSIPTGAVYAGSLRTGVGRTLVAGATGRAATGLKFDHGRLWVSGAGTGKGFVYDAHSGALIREYQLATGSGATFVNDVAVTRTAAFFTDSNRAVLYRVARGPDGAPGTASTLPLTGDFELAAGFNLNGIAATPDGKTLLAVQTNTGRVFRIDPASGATTLVDLGGASLTNGDGILLQGRTLYVVQNQTNQIAVVELSPDLSHGTVVRTITDSDFDVPTTIARFGRWLYAIDARFGTASGPNATYEVVQVPR